MCKSNPRRGFRGRGDILRVVADTFEVRQHVQINHAVLRGTLVVLQAIHVVAAEGFGRRVDFVLHALHFAQQRVVRYLRP